MTYYFKFLLITASFLISCGGAESSSNNDHSKPSNNSDSSSDNAQEIQLEGSSRDFTFKFVECIDHRSHFVEARLTNPQQRVLNIRPVQSASGCIEGIKIKLPEEFSNQNKISINVKGYTNPARELLWSKDLQVINTSLSTNPDPDIPNPSEEWPGEAELTPEGKCDGTPCVTRVKRYIDHGFSYNADFTLVLSSFNPEAIIARISLEPGESPYSGNYVLQHEYFDRPQELRNLKVDISKGKYKVTKGYLAFLSEDGAQAAYFKYYTLNGYHILMGNVPTNRGLKTLYL